MTSRWWTHGVRTALVAAALAAMAGADAGPAGAAGRAPDPLAAPGGGFATRAACDVSLAYRTWSIREGEARATLSQLVLPVYFRSALRENVDFSYLFSVAKSGLKVRPLAEDRLSGVTDGKLGLTYFFPDQRFSAGLGLRVPTGESVLDPHEDQVADQLNDRLLGFRVKRYGEGRDIELRGGYAAALATGLDFSGAVSYVLKGDFAIRTGSTEKATWEPGNELALLGTVRGRAFGRDWSARAHLTDFAADWQGGQVVHEEGTEIGAELRVREERLAGVIEVGGEALWKGETSSDSPRRRDVSGNILRVDANFTGKLNRLTELGGWLGAGWYGETRAGTGDGFLFELGAGGRRAMTDLVGLEVGYTLMVGHAEDGTIELRGHDLLIAVGLGRSEAP